jgi:glycosyltransferase involved in cell wall biosynthesis
VTLSVLLVGPLPPPSGGMANQTRQLAALLDAEGLRVEVLQTNAPYRPAWIGKVPVVRALFRLIPYRQQLRQMLPHADVVHVMANSGLAWFLFAAPAIRAAHRCGVPAVVNYRGGLAREFLGRQARRVLPTLRKAQRLVVPSGFLRAVFAEYHVDTRVIPNIVNVDTFTPGSSAVGAERPHVVVARNLETIYGIDTALKAIALLVGRFGNLRVSIAGSGVEREALEKLTATLGLTCVAFTGRLEVAAMADLYRSADVVLNPSRVDNTPNSILEALACEVPVVSTDVGGVPYLVEHGRTAWLVPVDDPRTMADGLARVLTDAPLRERLRSEGRALARACSWPNVKQQWLETYRELARKS